MGCIPIMWFFRFHDGSSQGGGHAGLVVLHIGRARYSQELTFAGGNARDHVDIPDA